VLEMPTTKAEDTKNMEAQTDAQRMMMQQQQMAASVQTSMQQQMHPASTANRGINPNDASKARSV
jgi:hypothetical protein